MALPSMISASPLEYTWERMSDGGRLLLLTYIRRVEGLDAVLISAIRVRFS